MWQRRWLLAITLLALGGCKNATSNGSTTMANDINGAIVVGGLTRTYHVHLPANYDAARAVPLLLVFHGGGGTGTGMITLTHMNETADQAGFIVVYPDGVMRHWADGRGVTYAEQHHIDDVAFIAALVDHLATTYAIDTHRVYATGISNGGFFTQRLGCDLSSKIAAIVSVAATLTTNLAATCAPQRPMPFMLIQGTSDPLVPYNGGDVADDRGTALAAVATAAKWASLDGCAPSPASSTVPDTAHDGTQVSTATYAACSGNASVALYTVQGGGHTWPSGNQYLPVAIVGKTTHQIDNQTIWSFLTQFESL